MAISDHEEMAETIIIEVKVDEETYNLVKAFDLDLREAVRGLLEKLKRRP